MPSFHSWVPRVSLLAVFLYVSTAVSGEFNQVLSIGDPAPRWKGLAGVDGEHPVVLGVVVDVALELFAGEYPGRAVGVLVALSDRVVVW